MIVLTVIPHNYWLLLVAYSIMGFSFPAMAFDALYVNEIGDSRMRSLGSMFISIGWATGEICFVGIGYYFQNWRHLLGITGGAYILSLITFLWLKPTPLFLLSKRRFMEFKNTIRYIAHTNGHELPA